MTNLWKGSIGEIVSYIIEYRDFNIFQVYQYFIIYRRYFLLKFEQFSWITYTTLFKTKDHFMWVKVPDTTPYWKACEDQVMEKSPSIGEMI
jgi:hypothetical protein